MKWHGPFSYKVPSNDDRSSIYVDWSDDDENIGHDDDGAKTRSRIGAKTVRNSLKIVRNS